MGVVTGKRLIANGKWFAPPSVASGFLYQLEGHAGRMGLSRIMVAQVVTTPAVIHISYDPQTNLNNYH